MPRSEPRPTNPFPLVRTASDTHPLTPGQERLWWLHQSDASHEYHITGGWRFPDGLDRRALEAAVAGLVARHDVLRAGFALRPDGTTAQAVVDGVRVEVEWAGARWRAAVERAATAPFDLARPPLLRVVAAELEDGAAGVFVAMHHVVTDRWSMDVLARDLVELYRAALRGREPELPELPVRYGDYAAWHRRLLDDDDLLAPRLANWVRALRGGERLELPLDRPRSATPDPAAATVTTELSEEATSAMTALAWRARATQAVVVTAALAAGLGALCGQTDVVLGAIISDRPRPELQDLVGFFVNTVALRVDLSGPSLTFRELVRRTRDAWMAADANQDVPFERVVGALGAGQDAGRNPLFDVVVNHAGDRVALADAPGAPTWWRPELPVTARFDLSMTTQVVDGRLRSTFTYRSALFDEDPIASLAARCARLLELGVAAPDVPVAELELVAETELKLLHGRNDTTPAPEATVVQLVQEQAALRPDEPAVLGAGGALTYRELNGRANALARRLALLGAGSGRVVAVCLDTAPERVVVLLAVLKAGAAYLPLSPEHPVARLRLLLADAGAVLAVTSPGLRDRLPDDAVPVLEWPDERGLESTEDDPPVVARPEDVAYLISTSGSTGTPKSVAVPHRALGRLVSGAPDYLEVGPGSVFLQCGPLSFDVAVLEWAPLAHGGRVVVTGTGTLLDGLPEVVREHGVTTLKLVSPQLDLLAERGFAGLAGLRQLVVGGDVVNPGNAEAARAHLPGCRVTASYGPTECAVLATVSDEGARSGRVPIGHPVPHTRAYVLDRHLRPTPVGMRGEIHLAGDGLALGYLSRPGLTAAVFVPDPFGPAGSRMYRTGDLGRRLPGGAIDFLGRADGQVKIRGFRIETSEVEHVLLRAPEVTAAVVVRAELPTGPALVAYVVVRGPLDAPALRARLAEALPPYLVPEHVVRVDRIPLTPNNKLDRASLPPVTPAGAPTSEPTTGLEARVALAWSAVLGAPLGVDSDFFDSGGHSLLVPRATAAVRGLLGREVPLRLMVAHRTPAAYAAALLRGTDGEAREHRLEPRAWTSATLPGERRAGLLVPDGAPDGGARALIVLDGSEFADVMRLPAVLDSLVRQGRVPPTAVLFADSPDWAARNRELRDAAFTDVLADELLPLLRELLGGRWPASPPVVLGASLGAVAAVRAGVRRPGLFSGVVGLSGGLSAADVAGPPAGPGATRFFLSASREEAELVLDDGATLLDAAGRAAEELARRGHDVRHVVGEGGHTYAAWEAVLPDALSWALGAGRGHDRR
ncbi:MULTISPECIES: amino acid adenylation domain-containing protein [Actinosynnema]|uniref:non-ribosomal peptide synthetase n=1 Tax=Actinosynnema TaxID=40566 RepID=UPI0020A51F3A|nr:amino acid adenylation domain-containing protein [Actinosynnema pretiosum]MCP2097795.1 amino acid adenylation domain-containing protein [Actinosynnema pretiosum]